jgi:Cu(I)/Ag(I) efflux system membrane fusion protein
MIPALRSSLAAAGIVAAAAVLTWKLTAHSAAPTAREGGHQHGATPAGQGARSVLLSDADQRRIGVTFAAATLGPLNREVRVVAQVAYDETRLAVVTPRVEGWVEALHADFTGARVEAGAPLLRLRAPMLATAAEELLLARRLESELAAGAADAKADAARLVAAARDRLRFFGLDQAAIARIESSGQAPDGFTIYAPVRGVVLEKNVVLGQRVMAGEVLYRIADISRVWLEGDVFEQDLGAARVGTRVEAEFPALPGDRRAGRISYVAPTLNLDTRTGRIRVDLPNPGLALKPGMFATLHFSAPEAGNVLSVPRSAVLSTGQRNLVFRKRPDGRFTPTDVTLGVQTEQRVAVLSGLAPGDTVVASATFLVDAESNLGSLLGGMGDMPGMDMTAPEAAPRPTPAPSTPSAPPAAPHDHSGHGG